MITHCIVCHDPHRFKTEVYEIQRIANYIANFVTEQPIKDTKIWAQLHTDHQHVHFMCGTCIKVDLIDLKREEDRLRRLVYSVICKIREEEELPYANQILRSLQGYYPIMYRCVERELHKKKRENEKHKHEIRY